MYNAQSDLIHLAFHLVACAQLFKKNVKVKAMAYTAAVLNTTAV